MLDTVLFDIDGTLIDTEYANVEGLRRYLKKDHQMECAYPQLRKVFGIPGKEGLRLLGFEESQLVEMHRGWHREAQKLYHTAKVFPGIVAVLEQLRHSGVHVGIVTSKTDQTFASSFEPYGITHFFDFVVTADNTQQHKPHPEPLLYYLAQTQRAAARTIYIGDTLYDQASSLAACVSFGLAEWGAPSDVAFQPTYRLAQPQDILTILGIEL